MKLHIMTNDHSTLCLSAKGFLLFVTTQQVAGSQNAQPSEELFIKKITKTFHSLAIGKFTFNISHSSNRLRVCIKGKSGFFFQLFLINSLLIYYEERRLFVTPMRMSNICLSFNKGILLLFCIPYQCSIHFRYFHWWFFFYFFAIPFGWGKNVWSFPWIVVCRSIKFADGKRNENFSILKINFI